ncbi:outer membrane protein C [Buttiauxella ferragutiae ATCC 51602]|uniref:Outer membrane protein C n=1 Tax=Buttiauxella ferragutiae ATCC 51602 TaxID=1354252 RepID=A0ABX2W743_9ENTR|nr:porin OmpC [Buttiauxella ferragutiae]MCE0826794.1 porin OmpC [Buttiauxella ferragutiae]OAT26817.1 outer membrane protein C [Buttiauxella ferragutiae ATCC 51602]
MKRTALALVIPALLAMGSAHAAEVYNKDGNKLDLYGKVDARHVFSDDAGQDGDDTYIRLGFKGETQITSELTGYGQWEYNIQADSTEGDSQSWTRLGFAGLKFGDYGSFDYGRNYGVVYDIEAWTDMLPVFGGDSYTYSDNFMTGRGNGMATYRNTDFFGQVEGLNFALQYQGANEGSNGAFDQEGTNNGHNDINSQNGDGWGLSTTYDFGMGFSAGAAYASSDRTNEQQTGSTAGGEDADVWTVGLKYDANNIYLATMYSETRNMTPFGDVDGFIANKTQNFEVTAQYQFDFGLRPEISYLQSKGKDLAQDYAPNSDWNDKDLVKYVSVGANYYFNKNFSTYVDYKINLLDGDDDFYAATGISTDDVVGVGMVYQF